MIRDYSELELELVASELELEASELELELEPPLPTTVLMNIHCGTLGTQSCANSPSM